MKCVRSLVWVLCMIGVASRAYATCDPDTEADKQLRAFLAAKYPGGAQVLAFDHRNRAMSAWEWKNKRLKETPAALERSESDRPLLHLTGGGVPLAVVIMNTNPVVFRVAQTESAQVDSASLESIKKFLAAFSGFAGTAVTTIAQPELNKRVDASRVGDGVSARKTENDRNATEAKSHTVDIASLILAMHAASKRVENAIGPLKKSVGDLKTKIDTLDDAGRRLVSYAQLTELGDETAVRPAATLSHLPTQIDDALTDVEKALPLPEVPCLAGVTSLGRAIRLKLEGLPENSVEANRVRDEYREIVRKLVAFKCDDAAIEAPVRAIAEWLRDSPVSSDAPPDEVRAVLLAAEGSINEYTAFASEVGKLTEKAGGLLKERQNAILSASSLALVVKRIPDDVCAAIAGVIEVTRRDSTVDLPFGKEGNETFKITVDSPFDKVSLEHGKDVERKYALARKSWIDPDVDVALTYTRLFEPTFALADDIDPDPSDTTPPGKTVRRTKKDTRAGQLAMMLTARFPSVPLTKYVAPQLGFLVSTGNPGAFAGLAFRLGPYFKLSAGTTYQKVTKLERGFVVDQAPPAGKTAVETRSGFDHRGYVALSITLDNIPFFKTN